MVKVAQLERRLEHIRPGTPRVGSYAQAWLLGNWWVRTNGTVAVFVHKTGGRLPKGAPPPARVSKYMTPLLAKCELLGAPTIDRQRLLAWARDGEAPAAPVGKSTAYVVRGRNPIVNRRLIPYLLECLPVAEAQATVCLSYQEERGCPLVLGGPCWRLAIAPLECGHVAREVRERYPALYEVAP